MDCNNVNLKKGSKGEQVKELQKYLYFLKYYNRQIDGDYGNYTVEAVKRMQRAYGNDPDGVFGKKTCSKCGINGQDISGTINAIDLTTFEDMKKRFENYNKSHKAEANIVYLDFNTKYRYVNKERMHDMIKRYDTYVAKNNRKPNFVYVNVPSTDSRLDGSKVSKVKAKLGNFTNAVELYNKLIGKGYRYYANDIYDWETELNRLASGKGLNCSDSCQFLYEVYKEMGYDVRYVHVKCRGGDGHIQLDIKYPKGATSYTRLDPAAALSTGTKARWGKLWCANPAYIIGYNPGWLMTDDGKT